jgi:MarR family transcriptional regulator for hemolysin
MKEKKKSDLGGAANPRCFYEVVADGTKPGSLDDKKLRVTRRILFLGRRWRNLMDEALRSTGDSHARWVTLLWVDMMAGRANLGELAEQIAVELPTLVRLLNRLERERLVKRRALDGSNREKTVVLTVKGKRALVQMSEVINDARRKFLEDVDEQRIEAALELLDDLLAKYAQVVMWRGHAE